MLDCAALSICLFFVWNRLCFVGLIWVGVCGSDDNLLMLFHQWHGYLHQSIVTQAVAASIGIEKSEENQQTSDLAVSLVRFRLCESRPEAVACSQKLLGVPHYLPALASGH